MSSIPKSINGIQPNKQKQDHKVKLTEQLTNMKYPLVWTMKNSLFLWIKETFKDD